MIAETERLRIDEITIDDIDLLYRLTGNTDVMRFFPVSLTYDETEGMVRKILDHYELHGHCFWKLQMRPAGEFIGIAGLLHQDVDGRAETEISYRIEPAHWNRGYATEAARACKEYAEKSLGKKRLISLIRPGNGASIRVAEKLGARKEQSVVFAGFGHDVYVYPIG